MGYASMRVNTRDPLPLFIEGELIMGLAVFRNGIWVSARIIAGILMRIRMGISVMDYGEDRVTCSLRGMAFLGH